MHHQIRILVVDDHHLVRKGVIALLQQNDDFEVIGEAADGQEAIVLAEKLAPDVVVMDIVMPRLNGLQSIKGIAAAVPQVKTIVLSMHADPFLVRKAFRYGAKGYLLKKSHIQELFFAIRAADRGEIYLSPAITGVVISELLMQRETEAQDPIDSLSPREIEVLQLVAEGETNKKISDLLHISVKTVEKHRASLMSKLEAKNIADLIRIAIKHRLISLE